jgi:hypothetical protein
MDSDGIELVADAEVGTKSVVRCCILPASRRRVRARVLQRVYSHCQGTIFHYNINQNVPNILISKECVSEEDGASADTPRNLDHVLKDSRLEAFLPVCVIRKAL